MALAERSNCSDGTGDLAALSLGAHRQKANYTCAHNKQHRKNRKNNTKMLLPKTKDHLPTTSTLFFYLAICERGSSIRPQTRTAQHLSSLADSSRQAAAIVRRVFIVAASLRCASSASNRSSPATCLHYKHSKIRIFLSLPRPFLALHLSYKKK